MSHDSNLNNTQLLPCDSAASVEWPSPFLLLSFMSVKTLKMFGNGNMRSVHVQLSNMIVRSCIGFLPQLLYLFSFAILIILEIIPAHPYTLIP